MGHVRPWPTLSGDRSGDNQPCAATRFGKGTPCARPPVTRVRSPGQAVSGLLSKGVLADTAGCLLPEPGPDVADADLVACLLVVAVHRKVGVWLSAQVTGATLKTEDAIVDADLNIHVADLLEAVTSHTVAEVDLTERTAPATALGLVLPVAAVG
jgi:hypothetical protein